MSDRLKILFQHLLPKRHLTGFAGRVFFNAQDPELGAACVRAWNDWMYEEWAEPEIRRLDEMRAIEGVGERKLAQYGEAFLEAIAGFPG